MKDHIVGRLTSGMVGWWILTVATDRNALIVSSHLRVWLFVNIKLSLILAMNYSKCRNQRKLNGNHIKHNTKKFPPVDPFLIVAAWAEPKFQNKKYWWIVFSEINKDNISVFSPQLSMKINNHHSARPEGSVKFHEGLFKTPCSV